jgi:hypothetical protein
VDTTKETLICPKCKFIIYVPKPGANYYNKEIFENTNNDIVKTSEKFGDIACFSLIIISNKFYKTITDAKLDRGLVFEPVSLY